MMKNNHFKYRGMTLVELMVAITLTVFIVMSVNQIFNEVAKSISYGTQTGEIIQKSRSITGMLGSETETYITGSDITIPDSWQSNMLGPDPAVDSGGILVIVNHTIEDVYMTSEDFHDAQVAPSSDPYLSDVRSDQLVFIYKQEEGNSLPSLSPRKVGLYDVNTYAADASHVKMWYGHVMQLPEAGWVPPFQESNYELGRMFYNDDPSQGIIADNPNKLAVDWVLGRQALFMRDPALDSNYVLEADDVYVDDIDPDGFVNAYSSRRLHEGLTDVCSREWSDINALLSFLTLQGVLNKVTYAQERLYTSSKPIGTGLKPGDIAPMHTYFVGSVSDFIVEYAHDYLGGILGKDYTALPKTFNLSAMPPPRQPDGEIDRYLDPDTNEYRIIWYTLHDENPPGRWNSNYEDDYPVTFRPPTTGNRAYIPSGPSDEYYSDGAMVWLPENHSVYAGEPEPWPWLIRIRYRLHDRNGKFVGRHITVDDGGGNNVQVNELGQWFEIILPVNRQSQSLTLPVYKD